ncbi:sigma-70 family RNA polymerase sigma factor [Promicromonospora thailandica]|uniref:RNA polymerase sigma factor, sigma-70 family n=1 Tax=Promicromonospora thailandica TaxID=765201 RepID=A0A9X2G4D9_9MICO|nr:sigma-70 family RNA polymerase sigma factor [Promicromonospora thailandica]MCP2266890.1 RNA polymerase sigma factor, sigma-70 family [Promicromonospora thailandica]BFF16558.1 sigma-70 family RNA polymerase sigma factor [Promicromonospora thailandica]
MTTPQAPPPAEPDAALSVFLAQRPQLIRTARRITGNATEADDVVQETWLRWQRADRTKVVNAAAFLTSTTTNLARNVVRSARYRHEAPLLLPGAVRATTETGQDPTWYADRTADAEEALALLLTRLTPGQLAAYVLRRGFDYAYADLASLLGTSVANSRQLVSRAQARLRSGQAQAVPAVVGRRLSAAFVGASRTGDLRELETVLTATA